MALQVNDVVLASYVYTLFGQRYLSTWTYRVNSNSAPDDTPLEVLAIAQHFATAGANEPMTRLSAAYPSNTLFTAVRAQKIAPTRSVYRTVTPGIPNGTFSTAATTGNLAAVVTLTTAIAGRDQIANKHIGPAPTTGIGDGLVSSAWKIPLNALGVEMIAPQAVVSNGGVIELVSCIFHRSSTTSTDVLSYLLSDRIGTMRRRTLRVGE